MDTTITEQHRKPRLNLPERLDDPDKLLGVLASLGLASVTPKNSQRLAAAGPLSASLGRFSEAQVSSALDKFEMSPRDRLTVKLAMQNARLLGH